MSFNKNCTGNLGKIIDLLKSLRIRLTILCPVFMIMDLEATSRVIDYMSKTKREKKSELG